MFLQFANRQNFVFKIFNFSFLFPEIGNLSTPSAKRTASVTPKLVKLLCSQRKSFTHWFWPISYHCWLELVLGKCSTSIKCSWCIHTIVRLVLNIKLLNIKFNSIIKYCFYFLQSVVITSRNVSDPNHFGLRFS